VEPLSWPRPFQDAFRALGDGHGASAWKTVPQAYMDINYHGIPSIENEDPILSGEVGVERAAYVLNNIRNEVLNSSDRTE
jgi:sugar phosphate isomerase/epimerase